MKINKGYISPYFINDPSNRSAVLNNPYVLIFNGTLNNVSALFAILEVIAREEKKFSLLLMTIPQMSFLLL